MNWVLHSDFPLQPPPPTSHSDDFSLSNKVSPSILLIIIILAIIFFVSGLLHLLVRFLLRPTSIRDPDDLESVTALQGQLQQLFHLHDAGVDQSFIDTLPVFFYKAIIGLKNPFDCAVCLCEFEPEDKLRLLPKCSHAFHMECIDTWLLSHSTCPLCRANLLPDFSPSNSCSPIVLVLESGSESSRELVTHSNSGLGRTGSVLSINSHFRRGSELGSVRIDFPRKSGEFDQKDEQNSLQVVTGPGERVVPVKLGKFRNVEGGEGTSSTTTSSNVDNRRCFSMGSFAYVMDETSTLQVPIRTPTKKQSTKKPHLPLIPGHQPAMSECGSESRREFIGFEAIKNAHAYRKALDHAGDRNVDDSANIRKESFSISKIWLRGKREKTSLSAVEDSSRRAVSFRFPTNRNAMEGGSDLKEKSNKSRADVNCSRVQSAWSENGESDLGRDEECNASYNSPDSLANNPPSFTRRTLHWLMGRPNKVVHSSSSPDV